MKAIFLIFLFPLALFAQAQFSFEGEVLQFSLTRGSATADTLLWSVTGDYYFSNMHEAPLSRVIWFPVPSNATMGKAEILELCLIEPSDSMWVELVNHTDQGFSFRLDLPPTSFAKLHLHYTQKISGKEARYVLLTANSWGRSLPSSEITLNLDNTIEPVYLSYVHDAVRRDEMSHSYFWSFTDFVPDEDFVICFK